MSAISLEARPNAAGTIALSAIGLLFVVLSLLQLNAPINHDVSWYIHIARGLLDGQKLYVDFIEVNPPLGMWMMVPVVAVADSFSMRADVLFKVLLIIVTAASLVAVHRYIKLGKYWSDATSTIFMVGMAAGFLFLPGAEFGQREHLLFLLFAPWFFLRLARHEKIRVGVSEACLVGVLAAAAILLKPQSAIAPLLLEVLLFWQGRQLRRVFAAENIAAAVTVVFYAVVIVAFTPEYIWEMIPLGRAAYYPYYGFSFDIQLLKARWCLFALFLIFVVLKFLPLEHKFQTTALFVTSVGFALSYAVQNKGYSYQILPASVFAWGALTVVFAELWHHRSKQKVLLGLIATLGALHILSEDRYYEAGDAPFIAAIERYAPEARTVAFASTSVGHGFPMIEMQNLKLASRYPTQWLMPYVASKWSGGPIPEDEIVRSTLSNVVSDMITGQPDIVFVDESQKQNYLPDGSFDYISFWSNDARFVPFWQNYERRGEVSTFAVYTKTSIAVSGALKGSFEF